MLSKEHISLIEKMRPTNVSSYLGQTHILGSGTVLCHLLEKRKIPSMILWGPPGCGKTSLTNIIASLIKEISKNHVHIINLSAANAGVKNIRDTASIAKNKLKLGCKTIIFMDEIHRFNKLQQDVFLPHVETGIFTLIGCTTENPSYSLNSALLSRCRVFVLNKLSKSDITEILHRAIQYLKGNIFEEEINNTDQILHDFGSYPKIHIGNTTVQWLAEMCDGNARVALNALELAILAKEQSTLKVSRVEDIIITLTDIKSSLIKSHMLSEKETNQSDQLYSALHKSIKANKATASLYWLARIMAIKEDPVNIARRLVRISSEDIGLADPDALGVAVHTMYGCQMIGMPECDVLLGQCTIYLAKAPKSRLMYNALKAAETVISEHKGPQPIVPSHLRSESIEKKSPGSFDCANKPLRRKDKISETCLPEKLNRINFFEEK